MRAIIIPALAVALVVASSTTPSTNAAHPALIRAPRAPRLFKDSRQSLAVARAQGRRDVVLVVASVAGRTDAAAADASRLGGVVRFRDDEVGYLRVRIPIDKATEFSESANIESAAADVDDSYPSRLLGAPLASERAGGDPNLLQARQSPTQWPPRLSDFPMRGTYSPIKDIDAAALQSRNPTYDGRGVTIALLDGNLDLLLPEFQTAYTRDGRRVPKIADFLNLTDPRDDAELVPQWVDMRAVVNGSATVAFQGKTFTLPRAGTFRIGLFDERRFNQPANAAYIDQDVDRNGNPKGDDGLFGVLWDERTGDVWVDTDRDLSFANQRAMADYARRQDVGTFGRDNPKTPIRETIGFTVQTDPTNKFVSINLGIYQHATGIMGSVVGNREPHGRVAGVAPGARLVSMFYGVGILHGAIEAFIRAFRDSTIDLIVFEQSVNMASLPYLLADARHPISVIAQRLATRYPKLMFVPGSNSAGFAIVAEDGLAPNVVSVGGYQSRDSYLANWGAYVEEYDNMHWGGMSHGPSGTGQLKPDLIAPSGQVSTDPGYRRGMLRRGLFELPPGYSVDGGTSTATPMAAGATALVVSAAKQRGLRYDGPRLKAALQGGARYIPRLAAHEQGAGLIQVSAAVSLLEKLQNVELPTIESHAPVRTTSSIIYSPPNEGVGLFEQEGWKAGDRGTRSITLVRTSGRPEPMTFALKWKNNDGTFSAPAQVVLPLNARTSIDVSVNVKTPGVHSALLVLENPSLPVAAHRVLCTIVASLPLAAENQFTASTTVTVGKPSDQSVFFMVPDGTSALVVSTTSDGGPTRLGVVSPDRRQLSPCGYAPTAGPCAIVRPSSGVWQIDVANNDIAFDDTASRAPASKRVTVKATAMRMTVEASAPAQWTRPGGSASFSARITNAQGVVSAASAAAEPLASAFRTRRSIAQGEQHLYEINVPKGATWLRARVDATSGDLDVYLLDCSSVPKTQSYDRGNGGKSPSAQGPNCTARAATSDFESGGDVEVPNPAAGRWVVVVDAYATTEPVEYAYSDAFTDPQFGAVVVADRPEDRKAGQQWTAATHLWTASLPEAPRVLAGRVIVTSRLVTRSSTGTELGSVTWPVTLGSAEFFDGSRAATSSSSSPRRR